MNKLSKTSYAFQTLLCSKNFLLTSTTKTRIYSPTKQCFQHFFVYTNNHGNKQCRPLSRKSEGSHNKNENSTSTSLTEKEFFFPRQPIFIYTNNQRNDKQNEETSYTRRTNEGKVCDGSRSEFTRSIKSTRDDEIRCNEESAKCEGMRNDGRKRNWDEITNRIDTNSVGIRAYDELTNRTNPKSYGIRTYDELSRICEETDSCTEVRAFEGTRNKDGTKTYKINEGIQVCERILSRDRRQRQICGERRQFFHFLTSNNGGKNMNGIMTNYLGEESLEKNMKSLRGILVEKKSFQYYKHENRRHISISAFIKGKNETSDTINKSKGGEKDVVKEEIGNKIHDSKTKRVNEIRKIIEDTRLDNGYSGNTKEHRTDPTRHQPSQTYSEVNSKPANSQYVKIGIKNNPRSNVFDSAHKEFHELLKTNEQQMVMDRRPAAFKGDRTKAGRKDVTETTDGEGTDAKGSDNLESGRGSIQIGSQFETEVQFSYDDLISFGKLSRDWNPIHYYPDDGRVQHLSKMFRIKSLDEIQGIPEKSSPDQTPAQSTSSQPISTQLQQNSTTNLVNKSISSNQEHQTEQIKSKSNERKPIINSITSESGHRKTNLKAEKSSTKVDQETSEKSANEETTHRNRVVHSKDSSLGHQANTKLPESANPSDSEPAEEETPATPHVPIIPGALLNDIISGMIGTHLPGPGTLILSQTLDYKSRLFVDERVRLRVRVVNVRKMLVWVSYKAWVNRQKQGMGEEEKVVVLKGDVV
uniref:Uncharacterized protein n=1 Tax=Cacopsylla melanoneura TaxID=428564 RepID=A0A8D9EFK9_9HEMI